MYGTSGSRPREQDPGPVGPGHVFAADAPHRAGQADGRIGLQQQVLAVSAGRAVRHEHALERQQRQLVRREDQLQVGHVAFTGDGLGQARAEPGYATQHRSEFTSGVRDDLFTSLFAGTAVAVAERFKMAFELAVLVGHMYRNGRVVAAQCQVIGQWRQ